MLGNEQKIFHAYLCTCQLNELMVPVTYVIAERIFGYRGQTNSTICVEDHNLHIRQGKQMR